jgi:hypothetical protein
MSFTLEADGKVKKPSSEDLRQADEESGIICLSKGTLADGSPYYAYIAVKPSKFAEFHRLSSERKAIDLDDYGEVLAFGKKAEPSEATKDTMCFVHGFDENFQNRLVEELQKERSTFGEKQEEKRVMDIVAMLKNQKPAGNA